MTLAYQVGNVPGVFANQHGGTMQSRLRARLAALVALPILLVACGGGGGGGGDAGGGNSSPGTPGATGPTSASKLGISLGQASALAGDTVIATITSSALTSVAGVDLSAIELLADLGQGLSAKIPFQVVGENQISFSVPMGVFASGKLDMGAGSVKLSVRPASTSSSLDASDATTLSVQTPTVPAAPAGEVAKTYLKALRELLLQSIGNYALLDARAVLNASTISTITQRHNEQIDFVNKLIDGIDKAQKGQLTTVGTLNGVALNLTSDSLVSLDRYTASLFRVQPKVKVAVVPGSATALASLVARRGLAGVAILSAGDVHAQDTDLFDIKALANEMAQSARDIAERNRSVVLTTLTVVGAAAVVLGAPEIALAAAGLSAVAWFTTTAAGAGIGLSLEAGSSAILNGQASLDDYKATGAFVFDAYLDQAIDYVTEHSLTAGLGDLWGNVANAGVSVAQTVSTFIDTDVKQAFQTAAIPPQGFPKSQFDLSVAASFGGGSAYTVTVSTSPAITNAHIQVQVSGTDGFRVTHDLTTVNGKADVGVPAGAPGVHDSINAYDIDGRAQAATSLVF